MLYFDPLVLCSCKFLLVTKQIHQIVCLYRKLYISTLKLLSMEIIMLLLQVLLGSWHGRSSSIQISRFCLGTSLMTVWELKHMLLTHNYLNKLVFHCKWWKTGSYPFVHLFTGVSDSVFCCFVSLLHWCFHFLTLVLGHQGKWICCMDSC